MLNIYTISFRGHYTTTRECINVIVDYVQRQIHRDFSQLTPTFVSSPYLSITKIIDLLYACPVNPIDNKNQSIFSEQIIDLIFYFLSLYISFSFVLFFSKLFKLVNTKLLSSCSVSLPCFNCFMKLCKKINISGVIFSRS